MSAYERRPWLARYPAGVPADLEPEFTDGLSLFRSAAARSGDADAVRYFDGALSVAELDRLSSGFAAALLDGGFAPGDRVAVDLQNMPQFVVAVLGTWKAGGIVVPVNPMLRERELGFVLADSGASVLVALEHQPPAVNVDRLITTSALDLQSRDDERVFAGVSRGRPDGAEDMLAIIDAADPSTLVPVELAPGDVAFLTYTSGTTGPPKGAMNTHGNVAFQAQTYRDWCGVGQEDVILGLAPLFHITGLIGHLALALLVPAPLVLAYRFHPDVYREAVREHDCTFTVGAITAFIALLGTAGDDGDLGTLTKAYSGGAPIAPSTVDEYRRRFGAYIHNIYGLTETTSPSHCVPRDAEAPVDPRSGALSVGVPTCNTVARVVGDDGADVEPGVIGEIVVEGPQVVAGYWGRPAETEAAMPGGALRTGDVGFMDDEGWFYVVDRKKDMIVASGYKVWPREVEDVLYEHPAVREAAVVGVPDPYRGETVKAIVSLRPGASVGPSELVDFCRDRMAAYKYPRIVEIVDDLPKTATGKILRRELRQQ
jgi:long-chain acyl-CoA synthetase